MDLPCTPIDDTINANVDMIADIWNPFEHVIWSSDLETPITKAEITAALESNSLISPADAHSRKSVSLAEARAFHASRIAWLVRNYNSPEALTPITIDFGIPGYASTRFEIYDGNHRFAAHLYSGRASIRTLWSGAHSEAERFSCV